MYTSPRRVGRHRPTRYWLALVIILLITAGLTRSLGGSTSARITLVGYGSSVPQGEKAPGAPAPGAKARAASFAIGGSVTGLYPGLSLPLVLTITNNDSVTITVDSITTTVANASKKCPSANLSVTPYSNGTLVIAPGASGQVTVQAAMLHSAPNACQGVVFPLQYTGAASEAAA